MSIPAENEEKNSLKHLDTTWKLATVYIAFMEKRTPQEAIRFIFNIGNKGVRAQPIPHNTDWIIKNRKNLTELNYIKNLDPSAARDIQYQSNIEPIIQSLKNEHAEGSDNPDIVEALRLILNSNWFRGFFSSVLIHSDPITYKNGNEYEPYKDIKKIYEDERIEKEVTCGTKKENKSNARQRLEINNLKNKIFQLLYEIGYYSHNFQWTYNHNVIDRENLNDENGMKSLQELLNDGDFDLYCSKKSGMIHPDFVRVFCSCL